VSTIVVTIDETGITAVPFTDVLAYLQQSYRTIYGSDIVIDADTQDGQWLGVIADCLNDMNNSAVAAFNSFIPSFAVGAGLSSIVKINGIARRIATASLVTLTLGGTEGTTIVNASVGDNLSLGTVWFIAQTVTIPPEGVIDVLAVCTTLGAVVAAPNTITNILTPTPGWQTVTNAQAAVVGAPIETDAQLRRRQTKSTAIPAETVLASIQGNLLALPNVTRAKVFQNDTVLTDPVTAIPARSIACVVEGGDPAQIAAVIADTKAPGVPTYGNTSVTVYDKTGTPNHIEYWQLSSIEIKVLIWLTAVVGYTSAVATYIQLAVAEYFNELEIGQSVLLGDVYSPANLDGDAAMTGTGLLQAQLDPLGQTYSIDAPYGLALYRPGMDIAGGANYPEGTTNILVGYSGYFTVNEVVWFTLDNNTYFQAVITSIIDSNRMTISPGVPSGRTLNIGSSVYGVGGFLVHFQEAAVVNNVADVILNTH